MVKVEVTKDKIFLLGHANYAEYGKDIVCSSISSIVLTSVEGIACIDNEAIDVIKLDNRIEIIINKHSDIVDKLVNNMISCLESLEKEYPKNIKIINKEE